MAFFKTSHEIAGLPVFEPHMLRSENRPENEARIRALCMVAYLGGDTALCRALGRYKMYVDTADFGLSPHIMLDGYWEMWVTEVIAQRLHRGMVVADIGANLGYFTLLMAEMVGPEGRVHAFEPNLAIGAMARRSIAVNGFTERVHFHDGALSDVQGQLMAYIVPDNEPKNAFISPVDGVLHEHATLVETRRLDSNPQWREIEFAKIDVEGAEQMVWAGAQGLLDDSRLRTVIMEFFAGRYDDASEFMRHILAPGFSLSFIHPTQGIQPVSPEVAIEMSAHEDIILFLDR